MAVVQLDAEMEKGEPDKAATSRSNRSTYGPPEIQVDFSASITNASSSPQSTGAAHGILRRFKGDSEDTIRDFSMRGGGTRVMLRHQRRSSYGTRKCAPRARRDMSVPQACLQPSDRNEAPQFGSQLLRL